VAQQSSPAVGMSPLRLRKRQLLAFAAILVAALCGAVAFLFFVVRDHGSTKIMVNDQAAPQALASRKIPPAVASPAAAPAVGQKSTLAPSLPAAASSAAAGTKNPFSVGTREGRATALGAVKIRLLATDKTANTFDLNVIAGRRSYTHRRLKLNQPLWISAKRGGNAVQIVATSLTDSAIQGYWTESTRSPQVTPRNKARRR